MRQAASGVNVNYLLDGTILKTGNEVRVSAQLIEAAGDRLVWGESCRGSFTGILELPDRIAGTITCRVTGELVSEQKVPAPAEINTDAKEACLMGDFYMRRSETEEDIEKAGDCYQQAAALDSSCDDAFAGLAFTYFALLWGEQELYRSRVILTIIVIYVRLS